MKITGYELFEIPPRWVFLKLETDTEHCGWGEPIIEGHARTTRAAVEEMLDKYLLGKDPLEIERNWQGMYRGRHFRGGPILMSAIGGIDQALWDIKGKHYDAPVYDLLGGRARDRVRVYQWVGGETPAAVADAAADAVVFDAPYGRQSKIAGHELADLVGGALVEAARVALRLVDEEPWRRERLQTRCDRLRDRLAAAGISTAPSTTHVLPVLLGDNARTMAVCERLLERGYYAQGIRHPSVPHGTARLRITPMATHEDAEIDGLAEAIVGIVAELPGEPPIQPLTDPRAGTPTSTPAKPGPAAGRGSRSERAAAPTGPTGAC